MPDISRALLRIAAAVLAVLVFVAGCGDEVTEPRGPHRMVILSGDGQVGPAGEPLPARLQVRVFDHEGRPASGVPIAWSVEEIGGFVTAPTSPSITDAAGQAGVVRTLGHRAGAHRTIASIDDDQNTPVRFTSIAQIQGATQIQLAPHAHGNGQTDTVLATLAPLRVLVRDHEERPVPGVTVEWIPNHGSLSAGTSTTDADGIAHVGYRHGTSAGTFWASARVPGLAGSPVEFELTAEPGAPTEVTAVETVYLPGRVNEAAAPYVAQARDAHGNAIEGAVIEWIVSGGGGSISPRRTVTAPSGSNSRPEAVATAIHTLGPSEGVQSVTAALVEAPDAPAAVFETLAVTEIVRALSGGGYDYESGTWESDRFEPYEITVPTGSAVAWIRACHGFPGCPNHDVAFEDDPTQPMSAAGTETGWHLRRFEEPGVYRYRCLQHSSSFESGQVGVVRVERSG